MQEQQRIAVGPGNVHFVSIHQVSLHVALLWPTAVAPPTAAAIGNFLIKSKLLFIK